MSASPDCPHCGAVVLVYKGGKAKMRTSILVIHKSNGTVESNCPSCRKPLILPLVLSPDTPLVKSQVLPRFGVRLDTQRKKKA